MKSSCLINTGIPLPCHPKDAFRTGFPYEENDPDAEADQEEQWARPEHHPRPRDLAIMHAADSDRAGGVYRLPRVRSIGRTRLLDWDSAQSWLCAVSGCSQIRP